jgi:hypothetical protein
MPKKPEDAGTVTKEQVEIVEKPKTPEQEAMEKILKSMEKPVQPPPIEKTLAKAQQAIEQAKKAKSKPQRQTWYCTDCGRAHCQNDDPGLTGMDHISVDVMDGEFVDESGKPLTGSHLKLMTEYAAPKSKFGKGYMASSNQATLAKEGL